MICILFQVPGRLGLLLTLNLIVVNIYNSVSAPEQRPFGYLEIWMIGVMTPILVGIYEYGCLLAWKKYTKSNKVNEKTGKYKMVEIDQFALKIDRFTCCCAALFFLIFNLFFWNLAASNLK